MKPWFRCAEEEKLAEIKLSCMLDCIQELAVVDGVSVPDAEDVDMVTVMSLKPPGGGRAITEQPQNKYRVTTE